LPEASSDDIAERIFRINLSREIQDYVEEAISADEFVSIDYYNLGWEEVAAEVAEQLRELLPTVQLGAILELHDRAEFESAQKPALLGALSLWTVTLILSLLLLGGGVLSVLLPGNGVLTILLFALLAIVGGYTIWRGQVILKQFGDARRRSGDARRRYREAVIDQLVSPVIREVINDRLNHYDSQLTVQRSPGLITDDPLFWIETANSRRLQDLMAVMPDGGSIGLAGPRGCGKTTLLSALSSGDLRLPGGRAQEAVLVTAPVQFAPREFLLHLFARICEQSLRYAQFQESPLFGEGSNPIQEMRRPGFIRRHLGKAALLGILCLIAGGVVAYAALPGARQRTISHWLRVQVGQLFGKNQRQVFADTDRVWHFLHTLDTRLAVIGAVLFLVGLIALLAAVGGLVSFLLAPYHYRDTPVEQLARRHLRNIRFQQSYSYGWSGSLTVPVAQVGINEAVSLAEHQQSLPDIVAGMRDFLKIIATRNSSVMIAVDELDKVASDVTAAQFLNDLKGIFGVRHCFYLVSVSEEALSNFELRGFPFRDAFDSAFDEVLHLGPLTYKQSRRLLQRRVVGLSAAYLCLCQGLAGGLPRDLVRVARELVATGHRAGGAAPGEIGLCDVVTALVQLDLRGRADATMIAIRKVSADLEIEPMAMWINQISSCLAGWRTAGDSDSGAPMCELRARELRELCGSYPAAVYNVKPAPTEAGGAQGAASTVSRLGLGLAGSLYYLATVIELFRDDRTKAELQELDGSATGTAKTRQIDALARARQAFMVSPVIAWNQVSAFRESWSMSVLDSPGHCSRARPEHRGRRPRPAPPARTR
jgi:hypothetical protein